MGFLRTMSAASAAVALLLIAPAQAADFAGKWYHADGSTLEFTAIGPDMYSGVHVVPPERDDGDCPGGVSDIAGRLWNDPGTPRIHVVRMCRTTGHTVHEVVWFYSGPDAAYAGKLQATPAAGVTDPLGGEWYARKPPPGGRCCWAVGGWNFVPPGLSVGVMADGTLTGWFAGRWTCEDGGRMRFDLSKQSQWNPGASFAAAINPGHDRLGSDLSGNNYLERKSWSASAGGTTWQACRP